MPPISDNFITCMFEMFKNFTQNSRKINDKVCNEYTYLYGQLFMLVSTCYD